MPINLISYAATPDKVFVKVPNERGRWMLTDRAVIEVECPQCKAIKGEPCFRHYGVEPKTQHYWTDTHFARRSAWQKLRREQPELADPARSKPRLSYQDFLTSDAQPPEAATQEGRKMKGCADGGVMDGTNRTTSGRIGQP